jgi:hypothetical protein
MVESRLADRWDQGGCRSAPPNWPSYTLGQKAIFWFLGNVVGLIVLCALIAVAVILDVVRDSTDGRAFRQIRKGDTVAVVESRLGKPDSTEPCGRNLWWGGDGEYLGKNDGRCVTWVRYNHFLSAWAVGYSADGKVVSKYHYMSE